MGLLGEIASIGGTIGSVVTGNPLWATLGNTVGGMFGQDETNAKNISLSREQMAFQERMSGTAYQRAVEDMRKAGLNPMLAYQQGGASTPTGSLATVENAAKIGANTGQAAAASIQAMQQVQQSKAQTDLIAAEAAKTRSETVDNSINTGLKLAEIDRTKESAWSLHQGGYKDRASAWDIVERMNAMLEGGGYSAQVEKLRNEANRSWYEYEKTKGESKLVDYSLAGAKAESDFYKGGVGNMNPYLRQLLMALKAVNATAAIVK